MSNVTALPVEQGAPTRHLTADQHAILDKYLEAIFRGRSDVQAASACGVPMQGILAWVETAEADPYVQFRRREFFGRLNVTKYWTKGHSVVTLAGIINDPLVPAKTKVTALALMSQLQGHIGTQNPDENPRGVKDPHAFLKGVLAAGKRS
ncbi:hypothetical protein P3T43_001777 [Paraburkholderia sp. GAS41]|uniref:hypothetical protein n=1 Tax=Paraburkholderia sp. GAS41 TaxID=3035134 RepID=UPI003D25229C